MKKKFEDQWPRCAVHQDYTYQYILLSQNCQSNRLQCSECLFQKDLSQNGKINEAFPLSIALNSPEVMINFIKKDEESNYLYNIFQICEKNLDQLFNEQISNLDGLIKSINRMKDEIKLNIKQYQEAQEKLKKIRGEFQEKCQFNQLLTLILQLRRIDKQIMSVQYKSIISNINTILNEMLKDNFQLFTQNINEFREMHKQMKISLNLSRKQEMKQQITQLLSEYNYFVEILDNNMNSNPMQNEQSEIKQIEINFDHAESQSPDNLYQLIDDQILAIKENKVELQKLQQSPHLIVEDFQRMWKSITDNLLKQMEKQFGEFSLQQYQINLSYFADYKLLNSKHLEYQQFFIEHINKISPFQNQQSEKKAIMGVFLPELRFQQFKLLDGSNIYTDIFDSPILERFEKSRAEDNIKMNIFYRFQLNYFSPTKNEFQQYLKNQFFDDFKKKLDYYLNQLDKKQKDFNQIRRKLKAFFEILDQFAIQYNNGAYQNIMKIIQQQYPLRFLHYSWQNLILAFRKLQESLQIDTQKQVLQDNTFLEISWGNYPTLKLFYKQEYFLEYSSLQAFIIQIHAKAIIIYTDYKITPIEEQNLSLQYIASKNNLVNKEFLQEDFLGYFCTKMYKLNAWNKFYSDLYDLILREMRQGRNDDFFPSNPSLVTLLLSKVKLKIFEFNRQFAKFGVILNQWGERCIYYYSMFLIWRFTCYNKWQALQVNYKKFIELENQQLKKFVAAIQQNKIEESRLKARKLATLLYDTFIQNYYQNNFNSLKKHIEMNDWNCQEMIKICDMELMEQRAEKNNQIHIENIVFYVTEQKEYMENFIDQNLDSIKQDILKFHQTQLQAALQKFLQILLKNIKVIINHISNQKREGVKTIEYFESTEISKTQIIEFERKFFSLLIHCLFGVQQQHPILVQIKIDFAYIFQHSQFLEMPYKMNMKQQSDQQIQLLKPYLEELLQEIETYLRNYKFEKFDMPNFEIKKILDQIRLNKIGCLVCCPFCKRKCDLPNDNHRKHQCKNGHFIRGMNFALQDDESRLYTCVEIPDDMLITTAETKQARKWKDIKQMYDDWDFSTLQNANVRIQIQNKMMNLWNGYVGQRLCEVLSKTNNQNVIYQVKKLKNEKIHYIFMLDESGSMKGQAWENQKNGALQCMNQIGKNLYAKVSMIIFNSNARVVLDCENVDIKNQKNKINFFGGGTSFEKAFLLVFDQIQKHQGHNFERNVILFYTDGRDLYPKQVINKFIQLPFDERKKISLIACSEESNPATLSFIVDDFNKNELIANLKVNIKLGDVENVWTEVVLKGVRWSWRN